MNSLRCLLAESIGTFLLCFAGIGAIVSTADPIASGAGLVGIALAHGLALSVGVNAFGGLSGAHFNPAVTISMLVTGRIKLPLACWYVVAQLVGATAAAFACKVIFPEAAITATNLGIPLPAEWVSTKVLLATEFVATFLLVIAIFGTAVDSRGQGVKIGGFGIGLTVAANILAIGPVTGASMNPARSFGPAMIQGDFQLHQWYWLAPIAGALVAALLYHCLILGNEEQE